MSSVVPAIVVHGGAPGSRRVKDPPTSRWNAAAKVAGIQEAARAGHAHLVGQTSSAVDAVQAAVNYMENSPVFNAGRGSALTVEGGVEMDAIIMEGKELKVGAVASVKNIRNPLSLARMVMDKSFHIMLVGEGANKFARQMGVAEVDVEDLILEHRLKALEAHPDFKRRAQNPGKDWYGCIAMEQVYMDGNDHDTVGAVAVDAHGNVACATSTGGITAKMAGRVGDTPLIGCGAYCDNSVGAVSTTGNGEAIAKVTLARHIAYCMEQGLSPKDAIDKGLEYLRSRVQSTSGAIAVTGRGEIGLSFTTDLMTWASIRGDQLHYGRKQGEDFVTTL